MFLFYLGSQQPKIAFKRKFQHDNPRQSFPGKEQCFDIPSNHTKQSSIIENNQDPSDIPAKQYKTSCNDLDNVTQLQKASSVLTTAYPIRSSYYAPATVPETSRSSPRCLDPSSQTNKRTTSMDEAASKKSEKQESNQNTDSCSNTSPVSALSSTSKGQEIVRLSEKRPLVKKSLSENAWNYDNRQFSPVTLNITHSNPVDDSSTDTVAIKQQCVTYSVSNYNEALNPHYNQKIPDEVPDPNLTHNANLYQSMVSTYGSATSATSQVTPEYLVSHQYPMYQHSDHFPSVTAVPNTVAPAYIVPVDERTINYEVASLGNSTNGTYFSNTNCAQTSHIVHQSPQVYQPIQAFLDPETLKTYYACYTYNQANQIAADNESVTFKPALQHGVYPLPSWQQVSSTLTSQTLI